MAVSLKSAREIALMRTAGVVVARILADIRQAVVPGVTTATLDRIAYERIAEAGGRPSFLGYGGFPASVCASVNEEIVHGIPGDRVLQEGDIVSIDVGVFLNGYHADSAVTLPVGEVSYEARGLIAATERAFWLACEQARPGNRLGDIGAAVERHARSHGYDVVSEYSGHGIGREMHEDPQVPNVGRLGTGMLLRPGMVLAIEPMLTTGSAETRVLDDQWTVVTADGGLSAHYEHTVLIGRDGPELLTAPDGGVV